MTPADIPAPPDGWHMACRCGLPVSLGHGTFQEACLVALEHLKVCQLHDRPRTVPAAVTEIIQTTLWAKPDHYFPYRELFAAAQKEAQLQGAPAVRTTGGCRGCG